MSEELRWMIIVIIAAVVLSWGLVAWRNRQRLGRLSPADADYVDSFWQKHPVLLGLIALSLAGLAQYALRINQPVLAAFGYWFAVILFISALRQFMPVTVMSETPTRTAEPKTKSPQLEPGPALPRPAFRKGRQPNIPGSAIIEPAPATVAILTDHEPAPEGAAIVANKSTDLVEPGLSPSSGVPSANIALERISIHSSAEVSVAKLLVEPAAIQVWTGFGRPQGLAVTANGNVLVLDGARLRVYCLNSLGIVIREWVLPEIPELQGYSAAFSPDGQKLYIADPAHGQIYSFTLNEDRL